MNDYIDLLKRFDEDVPHLEDPADRSIQVGLTEDMRALQEKLRASLGLEFALSIDRDPDRSWYGSLTTLTDPDGNPCKEDNLETHSRVALSIRVSNFGRLTTIFGCNEPTQAKFPVTAISRLLSETEFQYVPIKFLLTPYSGALTSQNRLRRGYTWFDRYFFYPS